MPPKKLNEVSGMPQMNVAFSGWTQTLTLNKVTQTLTDGLVSNSIEVLTKQGTWQPLKAAEIALKPEGQRAWLWFHLHVKGNEIIFELNDRVIFLGQTYKIMAVKDYTLNNYSEYHLIEDYQ